MRLREQLIGVAVIAGTTYFAVLRVAEAKRLKRSPFLASLPEEARRAWEWGIESSILSARKAREWSVGKLAPS